MDRGAILGPMADDARLAGFESPPASINEFIRRTFYHER